MKNKAALFLVVAALSLVAGVLQIIAGNRSSGLVFVFGGAMWFFFYLSRRGKKGQNADCEK